MGRPKKQIDRAIVERLAKAQCSNRQIAGRVGVDHKTIADHFSPDLASWREWGKSHLAEVMWDGAIEGDTKMQIHLAKQHLGHSDKATITMPGEVFDPVAIYAGRPDLLQRSLDLEREAYDASQAVDASDPGQTGVPGVAVSEARPETGCVCDGTAEQPDGEQGDRSDPG